MTSCARLLRVVAVAAAVAPAACSSASHTATQAPVPVLGGQPPYTAADVAFISGMVSHHAQAVQMAGWAPTHGAGASVRAMCERIVVGQNDEIVFMQRWLRERGEAVPEADPRGHLMAGMDHPMLMPGMLTPEQMAQLDSARGPAFDRLFLRFMIQHHQGAITMVDQLLAAPGAAQDGPVFRFANDVSVDQATEVNRMQLMLDALQRSPE